MAHKKVPVEKEAKKEVEKKDTRVEDELKGLLESLLRSHDGLYNQVYAHESKPDFDAIPVAKKVRKVLAGLK